MRKSTLSGGSLVRNPSGEEVAFLLSSLLVSNEAACPESSASDTSHLGTYCKIHRAPRLD